MSQASCTSTAYPSTTGRCCPTRRRSRRRPTRVEIAERCGDDFSLDSARLSSRHGACQLDACPYRPAGLELLDQYREACLRHRYTTDSVRWVDIETANEKVRAGDVDGAIELARVAVDFLFASGEMTSRGPAVTALVESLLRRGADPTSRRPRPRSTGSPLCQPIRDSFCTNCRYCGCARYWRGRTATSRRTGSFGIGTAAWRNRLASKDISRSPTP